MHWQLIVLAAINFVTILAAPTDDKCVQDSSNDQINIEEFVMVELPTTSDIESKLLLMSTPELENEKIYFEYRAGEIQRSICQATWNQQKYAQKCDKIRKRIEKLKSKYLLIKQFDHQSPNPDRVPMKLALKKELKQLKEDYLECYRMLQHWTECVTKVRNTEKEWKADTVLMNAELDRRKADASLSYFEWVGAWFRN
ncbi:hypothetical protein BDV3_005473 [Batrachochytrium dendrobatidis]|nr:hypothetical protein QVD99_000708 [Batrachochytrium dendrobatidis]